MSEMGERQFQNSTITKSKSLISQTYFNRTLKSIGPYRIKSKLGQGGMGTVYLAEQIHPIQRKVALKVVKEGFESRSLVERFEFERQTLASLDHPNISKVLDVGTTKNGLPYFAMELVAGLPITKFCDARKLDICERLKIFRNACLAISHAHRKGVLHRDIKPSNILVEASEEGFRLKVIDFGLARFLGNDSNGTGQNEILGTIAYMSPEQARGETQSNDTRSDVYSLGIVLFELLVGELPRQKSLSIDQENTNTIVNPQSILTLKPSVQVESHKSEESTFFRNRKSNRKQYLKTLKEDLDWILFKATHENRSDRYQSCDELIRDITNFLDGYPIQSRPQSSFYSLSKWIFRNRLLSASLVVLFFCLSASISGGWYLAWWARTEMFAHKNSSKKATIARKNAEFSENRSKQFLKLIVDSYENLNTNEIGLDVTGSDALVDAYYKSKNILKDDPIGKAEILLTLGKSFLSRGKLKVGESATKESLKLYETNFGKSHSKSLEARVLLIRFRQTFSLDEPTKQFILETWNMIQKKFDPNQQTHLQIQFAYAKSLLYENPLSKKGYEIYQQGISHANNSFGPTNEFTLMAKSAFAKHQYEHGKKKIAFSYARKSYEELKKLFGESHPKTILSRTTIADLEFLERRYWRTERIYQESYERFAKFHSTSHPNALLMKLGWIRALNQSSKFETLGDQYY